MGTYTCSHPLFHHPPFLLQLEKGFGKAVSLLFKQDTSSTDMMRAISQGNLHQFTFNGFEKESYISVKVTLIGAGTKPDQEIADSTY